MPILHTQISAQGRNADGSNVQIPSKRAMSMRGPILQVSITIVSAVAEQVVQQGEVLPNPVSGLALIDTGASTSCVDDAVAQEIGAPVIDRVNMCSASHSNTGANVYPIHFEILGANIGIDASRCIGAALRPLGLVMLIGRDVLASCTLHYNGVAGEFTLSM